MDIRKALDRMMAACSRREYCRKEIRAKLERMASNGDSCIPELSAVQMDEIVETLCRERFIDEARYASAFARDKSSLQGWGPIRIRRALSLKGISSEDIALGLSNVDSDAASSKMEALLRAKARQLNVTDSNKLQGSDVQSFRLKILRYGLSRGYSYDEVNDFLTKFANHDNGRTE